MIYFCSSPVLNIGWILNYTDSGVPPPHQKKNPLQRKQKVGQRSAHDEHITERQ